MATPNAIRAFAGFIAELMLWLGPASVFLFVYIRLFGGPVAAVKPHMLLVGSFGLAVATTFGCISSLCRERNRLATTGAISVIITTLYGVLLTALILYYVVIIVGLSNWGRVATWELTKVYIDQWQAVTSVLGVSQPLIPLGLLTILLLTICVVRAVTHASLWPETLRNRGVSRFVLNLIPLGAYLLAGATYVETVQVGFDTGEPFTLSLNPGLGTRRAQSNRSEGAAAIDRREQQAAAEYAPDDRTRNRNVVLIVGDALRGDRLGVLGYERDTTPYLSKLHKSGQLAFVDRIYASCTESYCGLMSIARSKFVHEFSTRSLTLQRVLALHHFEIGLILGGDHTNFYGLADLLGPADLYWDGSLAEGYLNDDENVVSRITELGSWEGRPIFLQIHLMSTHGFGQRSVKLSRFQPSSNYYRGQLLASDPERRRAYSNFYDNGMLTFDDVVRRILQTLKSKGYLDDAVVVITGDHGESLGERGDYGHQLPPYREQLDIPMIVIRYGYEGRPLRSRGSVSQVDIAPTILDELGIPQPDGWSGKSLSTDAEREFTFFQQSQYVGLMDHRDRARPRKYWVDLKEKKQYVINVATTRDGEVQERFSVGGTDQALIQEWREQLLPVISSVSLPESR